MLGRVGCEGKGCVMQVCEGSIMAFGQIVDGACKSVVTSVGWFSYRMMSSSATKLHFLYFLLARIFEEED